MRPLIFASLALSLMAGPVLAQGVADKTENKGTATSSSIAVGPPQAATTGGDKKDPEPHIYKLGEHLSNAYGKYDLVDDWMMHKLKAPPEGQHWVRYGENYMLVMMTDGLITTIVKAS